MPIVLLLKFPWFRCLFKFLWKRRYHKVLGKYNLKRTRIRQTNEGHSQRGKVNSFKHFTKNGFRQFIAKAKKKKRERERCENIQQHSYTYKLMLPNKSGLRSRLLHCTIGHIKSKTTHTISSSNFCGKMGQILFDWE